MSDQPTIEVRDVFGAEGNTPWTTYFQVERRTYKDGRVYHDLTIITGDAKTVVALDPNVIPALVAALTDALSVTKPSPWSRLEYEVRDSKPVERSETGLGHQSADGQP